MGLTIASGSRRQLAFTRHPVSWEGPQGYVGDPAVLNHTTCKRRSLETFKVPYRS